VTQIRTLYDSSAEEIVATKLLWRVYLKQGRQEFIEITVEVHFQRKKVH